LNIDGKKIRSEVGILPHSKFNSTLKILYIAKFVANNFKTNKHMFSIYKEKNIEKTKKMVIKIKIN